MSNTYPIYVIDAFTKSMFGGNPAAVCILDQWPEDEILQSIASENNLSETAFILGQDKNWEIRWFTPRLEVELCGHATLAAAWVIARLNNFNLKHIDFHSKYSGILPILFRNDMIWMDFPAYSTREIKVPDEVKAALNMPIMKFYDSDLYYMAVLENEASVKSCEPEFRKMDLMKRIGLIITAKGSDCDFVSRFFGPPAGIDEDPVTGSAHCILAPYWSAVLGKDELFARQLSVRGGEIHCKKNGPRVVIGGHAVLYSKGEIRLS